MDRAREPTPEELKARDEAARKAAPPRKLILTVDGAPVISTVIEGTGTFGYSQGEFTARATVKAGERFIRASYPELADLDSPLQNINPDMRRGLFVDYLDIVGPFNPSAAPPASYKKIFICSQKTAAVRADDPEHADGARLPAPGHGRGAEVEARSRRARADAKAIRSTRASAWRFRRFSRRRISCSASRRIRDQPTPARASGLACDTQRACWRMRQHAGVTRSPPTDRVSGERYRARVASLVFSLGEHARRRADAGRQGRHAAAAGRPRGAGTPHDRRPEGVQPGGELGGAVASAAKPRPHQARSEAVSDRGRRAASMPCAQRR